MVVNPPKEHQGQEKKKEEGTDRWEERGSGGLKVGEASL